jgi:hypothetical protein
MTDTAVELAAANKMEGEVMKPIGKAHSFSILSWLCIVPCLPGCGAGHGMGPGAAAALSTAIAVGAAGARRAEGDCFTWCGRGTKCNPATGLCEPIACGGECGEGEYCEESGAVPKCVPIDPNGTNVYDWMKDPSRKSKDYIYQPGTQDPASPVKQPPPPLE